MKKIIFSDCHWGGSDPSKVKPKFGMMYIYLGDNFEFKNIPKDHVFGQITKYDMFMAKAKKRQSVVIRGNHEVTMGSDCPENHFENGVLFTHGHRIFWSDKKIKRWETRRAGNNFLHNTFSKCLSKLRNVIPRKKLSKEEIRKAYEYGKKFGASTIVFGHTHPARVIDVMYKDMRIINVPRGMTELVL